MAHKDGALTLSAIFVLFLIASYSVGGAKGGRADAAVVQGKVGGAKGGSEGEVVHPESLCEKASQTWSGYCGNTKACDNQCIRWESARHGVCQWSGWSRKCLCYFDHC